MDTFLEWLRRALAPEFKVVRELGTGGQGTVVLAHDEALDRLVAIKFLRPDLASAAAVERFQREARILASLNHPNVVPIHQVGEADGLYYYVMDLLGAETLANILERGSLPSAQALKLGRDLLDGLEASHRHGVIHRDIKPSNVFLVDGRGVLTDFGIARRTSEHPTPTGRPPAGTLGYMAPEQVAGGEVTTRTDLYAVGVVLYETWTGRRYPTLQSPEHVDWSHVPHRVARVLRRAVALSPEDRWPDAASLRRALWRTRVRRYRYRTAVLSLAGLLVGGVGAYLLFARIRPCLSLCIAVSQIVQRGAPERPWIRDSIEGAVLKALEGYPDLIAWGTSAPRQAMRRPWRELSGVVTVGPGDAVQVELRVRGSRSVSRASPLGSWDRLAEELSAEMIGHFFRSPLDSFLPLEVKAKTLAGMNAFANAEHLFAREQWGQAYLAYREAADADSTCWLCYWRYVEVGRWVDTPTRDSAERARYLRHIDAFPPQYQSLIRADTLRLRLRFDTLEAGTKRWNDFLFGKFRRGDDLLHRGPLLGHARREATELFDEVLQRIPDIAPAWEHLAWLRIADGDRAKAAEALGWLRRRGEPKDYFALRIRALLEVAHAWRFEGPEPAGEATKRMVRLAEQQGITEVDAGARYMPYFGVPRGAIALGEMLESRPGFEHSALLAQAFGYLALGRPDSARAALQKIDARFADPDLTAFSRALDATLVLFDVDSQQAAQRWSEAERALSDRATHFATSARARRGAAWLLVLGSRRFGGAGTAQRYTDLLRDEPPPRPIGTLLEAHALAATGQVSQALARTEPLSEQLSAQVPDPLFRSVLHLLRAEWYERVRLPANAARELLWYENSDLVGLPTGDPQVAEGDWAFGTLARWRRARLLAGTPDRETLCALYGDVARLWADGESRYRARADSARARAAALDCAGRRP